MIKYLKTAQLTAAQKTNGGIVYLLPEIFIRMCTLIALLFLWRAVFAAGAPSEMNLAQMLSYTYLSALLTDLLVVRTLASGWMAEGVIARLHAQPLSLLGQLAAQTIGGWLPSLLLFSLPMALLAPLLGVNLLPASPWFAVSLLLCVSLGFAVDLLFACLAMKLRNMAWVVGRLRTAIITLLSGTIVPIRLLPGVFATILKYQPFAALGGAPLCVFIAQSNAEALETLLLQIFWNLILWPIAFAVFQKSKEGMVSYGG